VLCCTFSWEVPDWPLYLILIIIKGQRVLQVSAVQAKDLSGVDVRGRCVLGPVGLSEGKDQIRWVFDFG
jgi:hypothetical protein